MVGDWFDAGCAGPDGVAAEGRACDLSQAEAGLAASMILAWGLILALVVFLVLFSTDHLE